MSHRSTLFVLAALAGTAAAQTQYAVSPHQIYANVENPGHASLFGAYASGRHQRIDGNFRGKAMTIKGLSYRPNFDSRATSLFAKGLGRTWSRVTVQLAGSGDVELHATESLDAKISGSGDIRYRGQPRTTIKTAGSGSVQSAD